MQSRVTRTWGVMAAALMAAAGPARGGGLDSGVMLGGPRAVGRAGATAVSEDGGAALFINPGGLVRRRAWRAQIGMRLCDSDSEVDVADAPDSPRAGDRGPATSAPSLGVQGAVGPVVVGAAYAGLGGVDRVLPRPRFGQAPDDVARLYPHRYGGVGLSYRHSALAAGASVRARSWLGVGLSLSVSRVRLEEERHVWAGYADRDTVGDAGRDLALTLSGRDDFVPGVHAGVLIAPLDLPVEIAAAISYTAAAELGGEARLAPTRQSTFPMPELDAPTSRARLPGPLVVRMAARYLGERLYLEAGAEIALQGDSGPQGPEWSIRGVRVRDQSQAVGELSRVPVLAQSHGHAITRVAADVAVAPGFLWLTAGYAHRLAVASPARYAPVFADLDGHTVAVGAEAQWSGLTLTIGYARTLAAAEAVAASEVMLINPLAAGTTAVGAARYERASDHFGAAVEVAWY